MAALDETTHQTMKCQRCSYDPDAVVERSWTFRIDKEVKSMNRAASNKGSRWSMAQYSKERKEWTSWMMLAKMNHRIPETLRKRRLLLTRVYGYRQRPYDLGNLIGGLKPALDAMVNVGILKNDTPEYLEDHYNQIKDDAKPGLLVLLEDIAWE